MVSQRLLAAALLASMPPGLWASLALPSGHGGRAHYRSTDGQLVHRPARGNLDCVLVTVVCGDDSHLFPPPGHVRPSWGRAGAAMTFERTASPGRRKPVMDLRDIRPARDTGTVVS